MACQHEEFECVAKIGRLSTVDNGPITHYSANIMIHCRQCKQHFEFVGLPMGSSAYRPTVSIDGTELRVPITPQGVKPPEGLIGYSVNVHATKQ